MRYWLVGEQTERKETIPSTPSLWPPKSVCQCFNCVFHTAFFSNFFIMVFKAFMITYYFEKCCGKGKILAKELKRKPSRLSLSSTPSFATGSSLFCTSHPGSLVLYTLPTCPSCPSCQQRVTSPGPILSICFPLTWHSQCCICFLHSRYWSFLNRSLSKIAIWP